MALGGTYNTGLAQVTNGSVTVTGAGVLWIDVVEGDWLQIDTAIGVVSAVDDTNTIITLMDEWVGASSPTVTMTIGVPGIVTLENHGLVADQPIAFFTTGALPTGLSPGVTYYVSRTGLGTDNFEVAATVGGASIDFSGTQSGTHTLAQAYRILKMSWERYDPSLTQAKLREFLTNLDAAGIIYYVSGDTPDPAIGEDGQYALKTNSGPWQLWLKTNGTWTEQGSPAGMNWQGPWSSVTTYNLNDVVSRLGISYISIQGSNTNQPPESSPTYWDQLAVGGDRYDIALWASDRPDSGETLLQMVMATTVTFSANLPQSVAVCGTAATASAAFSLQKNDVSFATITFAANAGSGTFTCAADTVFNAGDVLSVITPNPRDATLANIAITLTGFR